MPEELRTEEEQVEAIKKWWDENGKSLVVTVVVVLGGYFGWTKYEDNVQQQLEAASGVYQQMMTKAAVPASERTDEDKTTLATLAETLKTEYPDTLYAGFASLYAAKFASAAGNFDQAVAELQPLAENKEASPVKYLAQVRLARVYIQQGKADEALALVNTTPDPAFSAQYEEAKGDALYAKGEMAQARAAYQAARASAQALGINTQLLQRKIDDLAGA